MNTKLTEIQLQYKGYSNTPQLWKGELLGLPQITFHKYKDNNIKLVNKKKLRLGHLVERFVSHEFRNNNNFEILAENVQIKQDRITIGELDCILTLNSIPIHLEIIYKFYLYDERVGSTELEHWIGPNRKDSLVEKLTKLKDKQLPLLYNEYTQPFLKSLNLTTNDIVQKVYFKAQLFVPLEMLNNTFEIVNNDCIVGFYIFHKDISQFSDCYFYIPEKINWLMDTQLNIEWLNYQQYTQKLNELIQNKTAPLCWLKQPNGAVKKFFVVWWN